LVSPPVPSWGAVILAILLVGTTYTDLRWRRIPNYLTFPALAVGLLLSGFTSGWQGLLLSLSGALLSPCLVSLMHGGRGPGMGDLKLAATVGAFLGPVIGTVAMLLSMIVGGVVALVWAMHEWGMFGEGRINDWVGRVYFLGRRAPEPGPDVRPSTIPYGVALAVGTLLTLVVCQCTGKQDFLSYVNHAAMP
jgi:prepilin peptidase CpaA